MSAHMVDKVHVDVLVWAGLLRPRDRIYWETDLREANAEAGVIVTFDEFSRVLDSTSANSVGAMLMAACAASVNHLYATDDVEEPYVYAAPRVEFRPVEVLKAIDGYEYQACEIPGYFQSETARFIFGLRKHVIHMLPEYDEAETWSVDEHTRNLATIYREQEVAR